MDWITGIQRAIDYTEAHLTGEVDLALAAREAASSPFHFQRVFAALCGMSFGEYIRRRRLALAGDELSRGQVKVIDVALKYGYETPESFTRAFSRFHGIRPSEARRGGSLKTFSRLSVKLILTGGNTMDYRMERLAAFQIIGKRRRVEKPTKPEPTADITGFWQECGQDGSLQSIISYMPREPRLKGLLGICFSAEEADAHFPYGIGMEYDGRPIKDEGLEVFDIPAQTYAVFTSHGPLPQAFAETYSRIVTEFFPQSSQYEYGAGYEFEVYPSCDITNPDYSCEIWVAVREK